MSYQLHKKALWKLIFFFSLFLFKGLYVGWMKGTLVCGSFLSPHHHGQWYLTLSIKSPSMRFVECEWPHTFSPCVKIYMVKWKRVVSLFKSFWTFLLSSWKGKKAMCVQPLHEAIPFWKLSISGPIMPLKMALATMERK